MIKDIFVVTAIADIHFGSAKAVNLYCELKETFLKFIKGKNIDMIVICGDYFNSILNLNSKSSHLSVLFMDELVETCKQEGIKYIRIIEGTLSHDNKQLSVFKIYETDNDIDFKIFFNVSEEILEEGVKILYLPEEYIVDKDTYYKEYFSKRKYYDFIFGHGMFIECSFGVNDGESQISKAPIFNSKQIVSICKGPIIFGHIHTRTIIRKHIHYIGSFSRWVYGQEEPKGFEVIMYDTKSSRYLYEFIENKLAPKYDTIVIKNFTHFENIETLINFINKFKIDNLRIKVILDKVNEHDKLFITYLREYYTNKSGYKLEIENKVQTEMRKDIENKVNTLLEKYDFVFDKKLPPEIKIQKFIERKNSKLIDLEVIKDILFNDE